MQIKLKKQYKSYPEYQDSGVEWLGKIPRGWNVKKLKHFSEIFLGKMLQPENSGNDVLKPYLRAQNINWLAVDILDVKKMWFTPRELKKHRIGKGDLLVSEGGEVGRTATWNDELPECYVQNSINRVSVNRNIDSKFLLYAFFSLGASKVFDAAVNRISIGHLTREKLKEIAFVLSSHEDQQKITAYLDEKTALIEKIIEKKQKLIEFLEEKRTAVINKAVTKVGAEERLKFSVVVNPSKQEVSHLSQDFEVSFVPMECLSGTGEMTPLEKKYSEVKEGFTYFKTGDVVLAKITPCFENGKAGVMVNLKNGIGFGTTEFIVLRPNQKVLSKYIYYLIFSDKFRKIGEVSMRGSAGQKRVPEAYVSDYKFTRPSVEEQRRIVGFLDSALANLDITLQKIQKSIDLLQEFKASLISKLGRVPRH